MLPAARMHTAVLYSSTGSTYEIGRALGNGGMGHVFLAQRSTAGRQGVRQLVTLKILRPDATQQARRLFYHEGVLLPRLQHEHIVAFLERGRGVLQGSGPVDYLALRYVPGPTLDAVLKQANGPLSPLAVLGIAAQLAAALGYLHERGIVHCDLKPGNVLLEHAAPRVVLIDFGIARAPDFVGEPVAVGTPQYMAPEQAEPAAPCDGRTDIYALGVLLYELLTGRRLFPRRTTTDIRQGRQIEPHPDLLTGALHPELAAVLRRAVRRDPDERYPTTATLLDDLRRAMHIAAGCTRGDHG
jgi:serine/threonine protein kinase